MCCVSFSLIPFAWRVVWSASHRPLQAAVKASLDGAKAVTTEALEWAKDKILMGAERKSAVISKETAKCTAFHEGGHALVVRCGARFGQGILGRKVCFRMGRNVRKLCIIDAVC